MKRWFSVALLIILVVAFVFLKQGVHKSSLSDDQEQQIAQDAQKAAAAKTAAPTAPADAAADATLSSEEVVGDPATAKHHIEVGWIYEDTDVVNANKLKAALAEVRTFARKSGGTVSAVIVDLDVPTEDRSPAARGVVDLGITMDGQSIYEQNPSEATPGTLAAALQGAIKP